MIIDILDILIIMILMETAFFLWKPSSELAGIMVIICVVTLFAIDADIKHKELMTVIKEVSHE